MSPIVNRPRLATVLNHRLSVHSGRVGVVLSLMLGVGIGFMLVFSQFHSQQSLLNALAEDVVHLAKTNDGREIERVLGSFNEALPSSRFLFVRDGKIEVSIPDMQLAQTAYGPPKLRNVLGMRFSPTAEMYSRIILQEQGSHVQYGELILIAPALPAILAAIAATVLSLIFGTLLLAYTRHISRQVLDTTLEPLDILHSDLKRVGRGEAPRATPAQFHVSELSDISELIQRQHQDLLKLTEVTALAEGQKRARDAVDSLLHDVLNPYTTISNLLQARIQFPDDEEIKSELECRWADLDSQVKLLIKAARHLEVEKLNAINQDLQQTIAVGAKMGAVKRPTGVKGNVHPIQPIPVRHDPALIARAVANLVRNSIEEGASQVEVWCEPAPLSIHIRDNGPGIAPEKIAPLFEGRLKSGKIDGSGVGFPTALRLVKMHGGNIYLEKSANQGTHFRIDLSCLEGSTV